MRENERNQTQNDVKLNDNDLLFDYQDCHFILDGEEVTGFGTRNRDFIEVNDDYVVLHLSFLSPFLRRDIYDLKHFEIIYKNITVEMDIRESYVEPYLKLGSGVPELRLRLDGILGIIVTPYDADERTGE